MSSGGVSSYNKRSFDTATTQDAKSSVPEVPAKYARIMRDMASDTIMLVKEYREGQGIPTCTSTLAVKEPESTENEREQFMPSLPFSQFDKYMRRLQDWLMAVDGKSSSKEIRNRKMVLHTLYAMGTLFYQIDNYNDVPGGELELDVRDEGLNLLKKLVPFLQNTKYDKEKAEEAVMAATDLFLHMYEINPMTICLSPDMTHGDLCGMFSMFGYFYDKNADNDYINKHCVLESETK